MKKKIAPFDLEKNQYQKLQKIIAKLSHDRVSQVSIREAFVYLIEDKYQEISGSMSW